MKLSDLPLSQISRIAQLCDFLGSRAMKNMIAKNVPVCMPPAPGALGFDPELWLGLGLVGIWAALDAFAERIDLTGRCDICDSRSCVAARFGPSSTPSIVELGELEDVRHLFAHNFTGIADAEYFSRTRHVPKRGIPFTLLSGSEFEGTKITR